MKLKNLYIVVFLFLFNSCEEELEFSNPNYITDQTFWQSEDDLLKGLASTYYQARTALTGVVANQVINDRGDDWFCANDVPDIWNMSIFTNTTTNGYANSFYSALYTGIYRANQVIYQASPIDMVESSKTKIIAEAKFLRALYYFELARNFGEVPIITSIPLTSDDYNVSKSTVEEVWQQIIIDLEDAKVSLPVSWPSTYIGRATKGAAISLLGKVYVYQKRWEDAENEFKLICDVQTGNASEPFAYDLLPNYQDLFLTTGDNCVESLFEIQNSAIGGSSPWASPPSQANYVPQFYAPREVGGWITAVPTNKLFYAFQEELTIDGDFDPRMYASIIWDYSGATFYNLPFSIYENPRGKIAMIKKYQDFWEVSEWAININGSVNEKILRYADVLLLYAETLIMQDRVTEAYPLVNKIRARANLSLLQTGYSADEMMNEIKHQRFIEFFREGQRFYDLVRWDEVKEAISDVDKLGYDYFIKEKHIYLPIPQNEINTNTAITQNPNW